MAIPENGVRGGYNTDHPPEDDCCPICFDSFQFPCRTNCGHWYCGSCFLQLWRHTTYEMSRWCKCPMCECEVKKLIPYSSELLPPGGDGCQILNDMRAYNYQYIRIWFAYFLEVLMVLQEMIPIHRRRLPPEGDENRRLALFRRTYSEIMLFCSLVLFMWFFGLIPRWFVEIMIVKPFGRFYKVCNFLMALEGLDDIWFEPRRRRARLLAQVTHTFNDD